jgi:catechol 2,3-dioxygenase-like lactoylglutathione lyase family enzyme
MIRIRGYDHVVLRCRDVPRMVAFYRDALGFAVVKVQEDLGLTHLRAGTAMIDLIDVAGTLGREGGRAPEAEGRNLDHVCFRVDGFDAESIRANLATLGAAPEEPKRRFGNDGYGLSIYLRDPEGNRVELKGPPEAGMPAPGGT